MLRGAESEAALNDFKKRVEAYEAQYEPLQVPGLVWGLGLGRRREDVNMCHGEKTVPQNSKVKPDNGLSYLIDGQHGPNDLTLQMEFTPGKRAGSVAKQTE